MRQHIWALSGFLCLAVLYGFAECRAIVTQQIQADASIDPALQDVAFEGNQDDRNKRAIEHAAGGSFAVKNALLGLVFNKINSLIDQKTAWVIQLDKSNIAKNKAAGIIVPDSSIASIGGAISGVIGQKLQAAGPLISLVTGTITSGSLGGSSSGGASGGLNLGSLLGGGGASVAVGGGVEAGIGGP